MTRSKEDFSGTISGEVTSYPSLPELAYHVGVKLLEGKDDGAIKIIDELKMMNSQVGAKIRLTMALTWASSFSDDYLVWNKNGQLGDPPKKLQELTADWLVEGLVSNLFDESLLQENRFMVIGVLPRIDSGDSILDPEHKIKIMAEGNITDEELKKYQNGIIKNMMVEVDKEKVRVAFGKVGEE